MVGKPEGKTHTEELGVGGRIILKWSYRSRFGRVCTGFIWLRIGTSGGLL
jgi:hypothetical protein